MHQMRADDDDDDNNGTAGRGPMTGDEPVDTRVHASDASPVRPRLQLAAGERVGRFAIGAELRSVVSMLNATVDPSESMMDFVDGSSGRAEVICDATAHASDLVGQQIELGLPSLQMRFLFDGITQRLQAICLDDVRLVDLYLGPKLLCGGATALPTFVRLYEILGPTFGSRVDPATGEYILGYPGMDIVFTIPEAFRSALSASSRQSPEHPLLLPDGTTPVAQRFVVRRRRDVARGLLRYNHPLAEVEAVSFRLSWGVGIVGIGASPRPILRFGDSVQDLLQAFGPPNSVYVRDDDRLLIHGSAAHRRSNRMDGWCRENVIAPPPTAAMLAFFTYPSLGIDVGVHTVYQCVDKIVFYNALPQHETFLRYHRCHFIWDATPQAARWLLGHPSHSPPNNLLGEEPFRISNGTRWSVAEQFLHRHGVLPEPLLATPSFGDKAVVLKMFALQGAQITIVGDSVASVALMQVPCQCAPTTPFPRDANGRPPTQPAALVARGASEEKFHLGHTMGESSGVPLVSMAAAPITTTRAGASPDSQMWQSASDGDHDDREPRGPKEEKATGSAKMALVVAPKASSLAGAAPMTTVGAESTNRPSVLRAFGDSAPPETSDDSIHASRDTSPPPDGADELAVFARSQAGPTTSLMSDLFSISTDRKKPTVGGGATTSKSRKGRR